MVRDGISCSRFSEPHETQHEDVIGIITGIGSNMVRVGAAWLDLPSELHAHTSVSMSTRAGSGLRVAGISSVWLSISSVSYLRGMVNQFCLVLHLPPLFAVLLW